MSADDFVEPPVVAYGTNSNNTLYQKGQDKHVKRYLDPWVNVHYPRGDTTPHTSEDDLRQLKERNSTFVPRTSPDVNLTAFAQLAALRLNCKRAIISLLGREDQYVLAEATQTISLQSDTIYGGEDELWLGHCVLPCALSVCVYAMARARAEYSARRSSLRLNSVTGNRAETDHTPFEPTIVEDISKHDFGKKWPAHCKPPHARFFAAIPIVAISGHIIGLFSVYDDAPRQGLEPGQIQFFRDMGTTVAKHLQAISARVSQSRGERLVKGLALFMEGKSSLRQWFLEEGYKDRNDLADSENGDAEAVSNQATEQFGPEHRAGRSGSRASRTNSVTPKGSPDSKKAPKSRKPIPKGHHARRSSGSSSGPHLILPAQKSKDYAKLSPSVSEGEVVAKVDSAEKDDDNLITPAMRSLFSRASNLIREACGVDGVMVYDASNTTHWESNGRSRNSSPHGTPDDGVSATYSSDGSDSDSQASVQVGEENTHSEECKILGFSVTAKSSLAGNNSSSHHRLLRHKMLSNMIKVYPRGKVFHYEQGESLSSSEENDPSNIPKQNLSRILREQKGINKIIGGPANSVAFFPLWDWHRNRWFAGIFAWTTSSSRMLGANDDLPYLKAFGNSIMTELARMDASTSDRAKAKFISSISHELRSPLHGILAGTELLQSANPGGFESNLVNTVENCGRTLLDVIDHLLEYSKITSTSPSTDQKSEAVEPHGRKSTSGREKNSHGAEKAVNLEVLTEEVLETLLLGLTSNPAYPDMHADQYHGSGTDLTTYKRFPYIIVAIDYTKDWVFRLPAGAWRRVCMNLVGNSLKFTKKGYVRLELKCQEADDKDPGKRRISLVVEDTGRGIDSEFLRHHLFTPFVQEDILSPGTGLGLHLTRQIVEDLRGSITVTSSIGHGTKFFIEVPLSVGPPQEKVENRGEARDQMRERMTGRTVALMTTTPKDADELRAKGMSLVADSLKKLFQDWFRMDVKSIEKLEEADTDLIVLTDDHFHELVMAGDLEQFIAQGTGTNITRRLLVLCYNLHFASRASQKYTNIQFTTPPFASKTIAQALANCFSETLAEGHANEPHQKGTEDSLGHDANQLGNEADDSQPSPAPKRQCVEPQSPSSPTSNRHRMQVLKDDPVEKETGKDEAQKSMIVARLLLVEDNEINMRFLVTFAKRNNLRYSCAQNGLEAVEVYKAAGDDHYDVVVMDVSMPVMDGLSATREIRRFEHDSTKNGIRTRTHIVALTGVASETARQDAFGAGVDMFLTKPAPLKRLMGIVEEIVDKRDGEGAS